MVMAKARLRKIIKQQDHNQFKTSHVNAGNKVKVPRIVDRNKSVTSYASSINESAREEKGPLQENVNEFPNRN